jgi:hypothetical protein
MPVGTQQVQHGVQLQKIQIPLPSGRSHDPSHPDSVSLGIPACRAAAPMSAQKCTVSHTARRACAAPAVAAMRSGRRRRRAARRRRRGRRAGPRGSAAGGHGRHGAEPPAAVVCGDQAAHVHRVHHPRAGESAFVLAAPLLCVNFARVLRWSWCKRIIHPHHMSSKHTGTPCSQRTDNERYPGYVARTLTISGRRCAGLLPDGRVCGRAVLGPDVRLDLHNRLAEPQVRRRF